MPPRIALTALALRPAGGGVQVYIRELISALASSTTAALVASVQADAVAELPPGVERYVVPVVAGVRRAARALRSPRDTDLVHGLDVAIPLSSRHLRVATVHDLSVFDVPWSFRRRHVAGKRLQLEYAAHAADAVIAVSAFTAERVRERLGREAVVTQLAPSSDLAPPTLDAVAAVRRRHNLPPRFVLHLGSTDPRKDVRLLAEACRSVEVPLVLAGPTARTAIHDAPGVQVLGYVPRDEIAALYGAALVVGYPSRYEGFGLPPLEAMACGAPVVASDIPALREVLADGAVLVPPHDLEKLSSALRSLLADEPRREALAVAGLNHAAAFSWTKTANQTLEVYRLLGLDV
jgi:glycosyltransferase involved in cell wall biosynthesis